MLDVVVDLDRVVYLRTLYYSWTAISRLLCVSRRTLFDLTTGNPNYNDPHRSLTDDELESVLHGYGSNSLYRGEVMVAGFIRSNGFLVPRSQLRATLHRIDIDCIAIRSRRYKKERVFSLWTSSSVAH